MQTYEGLRAGQYKGAAKIKITSNLTSFPKEILSLYDTLEILDLSNNPLLSSLPSEIHRLHKLKVAFFSDCNFTTFPKELAKCRSLEMIAFKNNGMTTIPEGAFPRKLRWLILTNNRIEHIPKSIGHCHRLQKCMLAGNRLTTLPEEMAHCRKLGLLRLSVNNISVLPEWLFQLPELSFLSFSGNPCASQVDSDTILEEIFWPDLQVHELLGEGASGIISKGSPKEVAIKLFKGAVTSDGSPIDEMTACILAGQHPHLISPLAKIHSHPENKRGLVLELIPPHYTNLGLPPTLDSCTRDAFHPLTVFSLEKCKNILTGIASVSTHLHAKGIVHGDLYAHNILINENGHALLGDFGAASVYDKNHAYAEFIEKMEVLAFGHLVEDLLELVERKVTVGEDVWDEKEGGEVELLNALHYLCVNPIVQQRPTFGEVLVALGA
ncbi:hypothetical protein ACMFMG_000212 [Clarireedia jacksonii]